MCHMATDASARSIERLTLSAVGLRELRFEATAVARSATLRCASRCCFNTTSTAHRRKGGSDAWHDISIFRTAARSPTAQGMLSYLTLTHGRSASSCSRLVLLVRANRAIRQVRRAPFRTQTAFSSWRRLCSPRNRKRWRVCSGERSAGPQVLANVQATSGSLLPCDGDVHLSAQHSISADCDFMGLFLWRLAPHQHPQAPRGVIGRTVSSGGPLAELALRACVLALR